MAARDMTFSIPEEVASLFTQLIDAEGRSRFVSEALEERLRRKSKLEFASDAVNADPEIAAIERDWSSTVGDGLQDQEW